jgi:tol-pal system protein YbgF
MKQGLKRVCRAGALVLPLTVVLPALGQQPMVQDLTGGSSGSLYDRAATRDEGNGNLVLFNQVQQHQEELRQLRGQVEELRHQVEQLRRQTRQQYLDLEDRMAAVTAGVASMAAIAPDNVEREAQEVLQEESVPDEDRAPAAEGVSADAQAAYQAAFARVQSREFDEAIGAFDRFVDEHPDSSLTANAHYWLGELHSAEGNLEQAEGAFRTVLDDHPESNKVPDALYKLGLLKARQGQPEESRTLLERLREEYPESSAAGLAGDFLR